MQLYRFIVGTVASLFACVAMASEPINIVTNVPPGGLSEKISLMLQNSLEAAGFKTNLVRFDNCKSLENWVKQNPKKPAIFDWPLVNQALSITEPNNPAACNIPLSRDTLVTVSFQTQFQLCSMATPGNAMARWRAGTGRMGITGTPAIHKTMAEQIVADLSPDTKIVVYKSNPALIQAVASGEVAFAGQFSNAGAITSAGAKCFFTLGDREKAKKIGSTSVDDIKPNSSVAGMGYLSTVVGYNLDMDKVRPVVVAAIKNNEDLKKHFSAGADPKGLVIGQTPDQQWKDVENYLNRFRK
jgi:hypothetical protein